MIPSCQSPSPLLHRRHRLEIACKLCLDCGCDAIDWSLDPDYDPDEECARALLKSSKDATLLSDGGSGEGGGEKGGERGVVMATPCEAVLDLAVRMEGRRRSVEANGLV
ncbi:hypothetical protein Droror1_Dr00002090 [Drosera rotundifolia]